MITTSNTYGIQASVNYDEHEYLVCEAAIPISFFHVDDITKNEWAFNFRINGITKQIHAKNGEEEGAQNGGSRGGRGGGMGGGGMGGGMGGGGHKGRGGNKGGGDQGDENRDPAALFKSEDFWERFYLAK